MFKFQWFITVFPTILWSWKARNRDTHDEIVTVEHAVAPWVEHFNLAHNKLTSLPNSFLSLQNIRILDLSHNNLSGTLVFIDLMQLDTLEKLSLSDNKIRELPSNSTFPASLTYLDISRNKLTNLPSCISTSNLQCLICQGNGFSHLPAPLFQLHSLQIIDLKDNTNGLSDVELLISKFSSEVKFISPDGEIYRSRQMDEALGHASLPQQTQPSAALHSEHNQETERYKNGQRLKAQRRDACV